MFKLRLFVHFGKITNANFTPFRYIRMTPERFEHLLSLVGPRITKTNTRMREAVSAAERLTLTLRYLAGLCNNLICSSTLAIFG